MQGNLADCLASEDDERRFDGVIGSASHNEVSPAILNVHIKLSSRPLLLVEFFRPSLLDPQPSAARACRTSVIFGLCGMVLGGAPRILCVAPLVGST